MPYYLAESMCLQAGVLAAQQRFSAALASAEAALQLATAVERKDTRFKAQLLALDLRARQGQRERAAAIGECGRMLARWAEPEQQAAIFHQLWRLSGRDEHRSQAEQVIPL